MKQNFIGRCAAMALCALLTINVSVAQTPMKVKPQHAAPPPAAQHLHNYTQLNLEGSSTGAPYGLEKVNLEDKTVVLRWNTPEATNGYFEDFEGHADFVINSQGNIGWDYLDGDNQDTYTWAATSFPNQGQRMAFIVMNPSQTSPSVEDWPDYQPFSGKKMLVGFTVDGGNNDFIISPQLNFEEDFQISFRARSYTEQYGKERVRVGYSTTGKRPSDFTWVTAGEYEEVPAAWTLYQYSIPKDAKYVTINCVSHEAFMLMIDDIYVGTNIVRPRSQSKMKVQGFNIYRDGIKINNTPWKEVTYTDNVPDYATYTYAVKAVYTDGHESESSNTITIDFPDIRLLPFVDDFNTWVLNTDNWSTPVDEAGNDNKWKVDYYAYGLVDPAATYVYSNLTNYSQSLITRELNTPQLDNTYLRFDLRLLNYNTYDGDTLSVEVSSDNGTTWKVVDHILNKEGSYAPRQFIYSLKGLLDSNLFRLRFRAHGLEAFYIDYWYVDNVKVWNPEFTTAELKVVSKGAPLANTPVNLTATHGAKINTTTDANGCISFSQIETGTYTVSINLKGANTFSEEWNIAKDTNNQFTATVTQPELSLTANTIHADLVAETDTKQTTLLTNTGDGPAAWNLELTPAEGSGNVADRWNVQRSFDASGDLQSSVAFDGEHYYTASWYYLGKFFKYDKDGNFIEEFSIPGMYYKLYDLAFDGTYFYGSDLTNVVYQLDFRNKRLVKEITINEMPDIKITHCAYDKKRGELWVGSFTNVGRINLDGKITQAFRNIDTARDMGAYGSAYDDITPGGPYLWIANETVEGSNQIDNVQILQYNLNTGKVTDVIHYAHDVPGYKVGSLNSGPNNICGIETTTQLEDGSLSLVGILQQSPSRIFAYKLCDVDTWCSAQPKSGTLQPGESQEITLMVNARNGKVGETYSTHYTLHSNPEKEDILLPVSYTVSAPSSTPRPVQLAATLQGVSEVQLTWKQANESIAPTAYNIFKNGIKINQEPVQTTHYTDLNVLHGEYTYTVTALYDAVESVHSDTAFVSVPIGAPYYAPDNLSLNVIRNQDVALTWQHPGTLLHQPATLAYHNGHNNKGIGLEQGGYFWAGCEWGYDELVSHRGMMLDSVSVFISAKCLQLRLQIYKDGTRIINQNITQPLTYGAFNTIKLNTPLSLELGHKYRVTFFVAHDAGMLPMGIDASRQANSKANVMSTDGREWVPASFLGFDEGNFNITLHVNPSTSEEAAPVAYNVWRNGVKITTEPIAATNYQDALSEAGKYTYQVSSVYEGGGESALSEIAEAEILQLDAAEAPTLLRADVQLGNNVSLHWNLPKATTFPVDIAHSNHTTAEGHPEFVSAFRGAIAGELAVATDGQHLYTSLYKSPGAINQYTLDGTFVKSFTIKGCTSNAIRNLAFDGTHFYAADTESWIYRLDMENQQVLDTITISEYARHINYSPELNGGKGGFVMGDWTTSIYTDKAGAKIGDGPALKGASGTAIHNGVLYAFEQGHEDAYSLSCYDVASGKHLRTISLADYVEITPSAEAAAAGLSVFNLPDGLHLLALALQEGAGTRFIFLDLGSVLGLEGYNVYRNGEKVNTAPLKHRYFAEQLSTPGTYTYEVETQLIDGTISERSIGATIDILDAGSCDVPASVKARPGVFAPYNVQVSYSDPTYALATQFESFENATEHQAPMAGVMVKECENWTATTDEAFDGNLSLTAQYGSEASIVFALDESLANISEASPTQFSFVARCADDAKGKAQLRILTGTDSYEQSNLIPLKQVSCSESWEKFTCSLPAGTRYVVIEHNRTSAAAYLDAICADAANTGHAYAYDIYRDGTKLNDQPVSTVSYTDTNLRPGTYNYQVRAYYLSSCISELSEPVSVTVDYTNGAQKPGQLSVERTATGNMLRWSEPALGEATQLQWHSGTPHDAAGMPSGGAFYAGVQWSADELKPYAALSLSDVSLYINQIPDALYLLVYEGNTLKHMQYVPSLKQYSYNTITLKEPLAINAEKTLRVVAYVEHNEISVPLGYDEGPARTGRGDLYSRDGFTWETLTDNDIDGNWNITLMLSAYADKNTASTASAASTGIDAFKGYNVYCNNTRLNATPLQTTEYHDEATHTGRYIEYHVAAIYALTGEVKSNTVRMLSLTDITGTLAEGITFAQDGNKLHINGITKPTAITLHSAAGRMVYATQAAGGKRHTIDTSHLPEGAYILRAGTATCKVLISR